MSDPLHPPNQCYTWLPSRSRLCSSITTNRFKKAFVPLSVVHLSAMNWCLGLTYSVILFLWHYYIIIVVTSVCHWQQPLPLLGNKDSLILSYLLIFTCTFSVHWLQGESKAGQRIQIDWQISHRDLGMSIPRTVFVDCITPVCRQPF